MRDKNAETLVQKIKSDPDLNKIRLILYTSCGMRGDAAWAKEINLS